MSAATPARMRKAEAVLHVRLVSDSAKRLQTKGADRKGGPAPETLWTNQLIAGLTGIVAAVLLLMIARRPAQGVVAAA